MFETKISKAMQIKAKLLNHDLTELTVLPCLGAAPEAPGPGALGSDLPLAFALPSAPPPPPPPRRLRALSMCAAPLRGNVPIRLRRTSSIS